MERTVTERTLLLGVILLSGAAAHAQQPEGDVDAKAIVKKLDELYRSRSSFADIAMEIATPHFGQCCTPSRVYIRRR